MITIIDKAEEQLIRLLQDAIANKTQLGCLHIQGNSLPHAVFDRLPAFLIKFIGDPEGKILTCFNKQMFVLSETFDSRFFDRFCERFYDFVGPDSDTAMPAFYDLSANQPALIALASQQFEKRQAWLKAQADTARLAALNVPISPELIASLPKRRALRAHTSILVVEDDPFSRRLINLAISGDFAVSTAETAAKGILEYVTQAPDILFLDIGLPDVSGLDVLRRILAIDPEAYVVILSGNSQAENVMQAVRMGAKGFIGKPFAREKLYQYIRKSPRATAQG